MSKYKALVFGALLGIALLVGPVNAMAEGQVRLVDPYNGCWREPPRMQLYETTGKFAGPIMIDNKTGESYQKLVVQGADGKIKVYWLRLNKVDDIPKGSQVLWK